MDAYMYGAGGMFPCNPEYPHSWVKSSEAKAEIARLRLEKQYALDTADAAIEEVKRLKAEAERLRSELSEALEGWHVEMPNSSTIHNDAIEKAASLFTHLEEEGIADRIRELRE